MDPTACLYRALIALISDDRYEAANALADLQGWLATGGFLPNVPKALFELTESAEWKSLLMETEEQ